MGSGAVGLEKQAHTRLPRSERKWKQAKQPNNIPKDQMSES
jgi:hypothetical protein